MWGNDCHSDLLRCLLFGYNFRDYLSNIIIFLGIIMLGEFGLTSLTLGDNSRECLRNVHGRKICDRIGSLLYYTQF